MVSFTLNGRTAEFDVTADLSLLIVLANDAGLAGVKYGCGLSQCGACKVLIDGKAQNACVIPVGSVEGKDVKTLAGLREGEGPGRLQRAFIAEQAAQCGYCVSGIIIAAEALLNRNPTPTEGEVRAALDGNLCRCGTHNRIVRAVLRAAQEG